MRTRASTRSVSAWAVPLVGMPVRLIAYVLAWVLIGSGASAQSVRFLNEAQAESAEGHLTLKWVSDLESPRYQVEHATSESFDGAKLWYEGPATQTFLSGLEEGTHFYRVRVRERTDDEQDAVLGGDPDRGGDRDGESGGDPGGRAESWGPWSEPVSITVEHQSMQLAWGLFGAGAAMFACIVGFVVWHATGGRLEQGVTGQKVAGEGVGGE